MTQNELYKLVVTALTELWHNQSLNCSPGRARQVSYIIIPLKEIVEWEKKPHMGNR